MKVKYLVTVKSGDHDIQCKFDAIKVRSVE